MGRKSKTIDGMRECNICKITKPLSEFTKHSEKYYHAECRDCMITKRREFRNWINSFKEKPCADCGKEYPAVLMDFDHVPERGEKLAKVSSLGNRKAVLEEIAKCDVVCPLCHRIRTVTRAGLLTEEEINVLSKF